MRKFVSWSLSGLVITGLLAVAVSAIGNTTVSALMKQAEEGDVSAMRHLGEIYLDGSEVARNDELGLEWLRAAADQNDLRAHYRLALHFQEQAKTPANQERMIKHYRRAAELGHTTAQARVADLLLERADDMAYNEADRTRARDQALQLYAYAAKAGNHYALWRTSQLLAEGRHLTKDPVKAIAYARKASSAGSAPASMVLAKHHLDDPRAAQYNEARGIYYLKRAAEMNDPQALTALARRRLEGNGMPKDLAEAERLAKAATQRGYAAAKTILASIDAERTKQAREQAEAEQLALVHEREEAKLKQERATEAEAIAKLEAERAALQAERTQLAAVVPAKDNTAVDEPVALSTLLAAAPVQPTVTPAPATAAPQIVEATPAPASQDTLDALGGDSVVLQLTTRLDTLDARLGEVEEESRALRAQLADREARLAVVTAERDAARSALVSAEQMMTQALAMIRSERDVSAIALLPPPVSTPAQAAPAATQQVAAAPAPVAMTVAIGADQRAAEAANRTGLLAAREKRFELALDHFRKAAKLGHGGAMNNLGMLVLRGQGTRANLAAAMKHFEDAANLGTAAAANNLGYIYQHGLGVKADRDAAITWYQQAAALGSQDAQRSLLALGVAPKGPALAGR